MANKIVELRQKNIFKKRNVYSQIVKNEYVIPHTHDFIEFFYVINGQCTQNIYDEKIEIIKNDAFILFPGDTHELIEDKQYFLHRDILFNANFFKSICDIYSPNLYDDLLNSERSTIHLDLHDISQIEKCTGALLNQKQRCIYEGLLASYIINILILKLTKEKVIDQKIPNWVNHLTFMLSTPSNFNTKLSDILASFNYSHEYMSKIFKKYTGKTPINYFVEKKVGEAARQLVETNFSVKKISENTGFDNLEHFYHTFKRYMKTTPKQYRASMK